MLDLGRGVEECTLTGHTSAVRAVAVTPDGRRALSASDDHTVKVWDLVRGEVVASLRGETRMESCAVSPDGSTFVVGDRSGRVHFLRLEGV